MEAGLGGQDPRNLVARAGRLAAAIQRSSARSPNATGVPSDREQEQDAEQVWAQQALALAAQVIGRRGQSLDGVGHQAPDDLEWQSLAALPDELRNGSNMYSFELAQGRLAAGSLGTFSSADSQFSLSAGTALGLALASCMALLALLAVFIAGPPILALSYGWAWVVWMSHWASPCDQPLDAWLGVYLLYTVVVLCFGQTLMQALCRWSRRSHGQELPFRVKMLKIVHPILPFSWMVLGKILLARSSTCHLTSPGLHGFLGWFSCLFLVLHSSHVAWMLLSVAGVPLLLFLSRRGFLHSFLLWLASHGLLETAAAANPDLINELEVVEFRPELFADPSSPADTRPQGECAICLQAYDASKVIRRTPCGHLMHHECLGMWLQTASTCPACRGDLNRLHNSTDGVV